MPTRTHTHIYNILDILVNKYISTIRWSHISNSKVLKRNDYRKIMYKLEKHVFAKKSIIARQTVTIIRTYIHRTVWDKLSTNLIQIIRIL